MFDQHYKKESPTFTGITRGVGGFGFGAASAADDSGGGDGLPTYTDWGGGQPVWDKSSYTSYTISSPSVSGLNISGHYGMGTDSFHRYLIFTQRFQQDATIWVPILANGNPDPSARFGVFPTINSSGTNFFGGFADTVRGRMYHTEYGSGHIVGNDLPPILTGLETNGGYLKSSQYVVQDQYNLANENGWPGASTSWPPGGACDGGYHDGWNDMYYFVGRNEGRTHYYNPSTSSWANTSYYATASGHSGWYGICRDPSSNYFVYATRDVGWWMTNGFNYGSSSSALINTYTSGFTQSFPNNSEDVVIAWNGDIYAWTGQGSQVHRWTRTA